MSEIPVETNLVSGLICMAVLLESIAALERLPNNSFLRQKSLAYFVLTASRSFLSKYGWQGLIASQEGTHELLV